MPSFYSFLLVIDTIKYAYVHMYNEINILYTYTIYYGIFSKKKKTIQIKLNYRHCLLIFKCLTIK